MPEPGERKIITADGHDVAASLNALDNKANGYTYKRHLSWLTPSGKVLKEGQRYEVEWVQRFRSCRIQDEYQLLDYRGGWEIMSEALNENENN